MALAARHDAAAASERFQTGRDDDDVTATRVESTTSRSDSEVMLLDPLYTNNRRLCIIYTHVKWLPRYPNTVTD